MVLGELQHVSGFLSSIPFQITYLGPLHLRGHQFLLHIGHVLFHRAALILHLDVALHDTVHLHANLLLHLGWLLINHNL